MGLLGSISPGQHSALCSPFSASASWLQPLTLCLLLTLRLVCLCSEVLSSITLPTAPQRRTPSPPRAANPLLRTCVRMWRFPGPRLSMFDNCRNATVQQCGLQPVEEEGDGVEAERKRREADPQFVYGAPFHPVVPLLKHVCEETTQEYCFPEAKIVEVTNTVQRCLLKTSVECEDVEHKIPRVVCAPTPLPAPVPVL